MGPVLLCWVQGSFGGSERRSALATDQAVLDRSLTTNPKTIATDSRECSYSIVKKKQKKTETFILWSKTEVHRR